MRLKVLASLVAAGGSAIAALWTFPSILVSAFLVAWGAEAAQFLISQGLALAVLAWLQTLPEFAVEAAVAWDAGREPARAHLAIANLTGAIRLLLGFGWPLIYAVFAFANRRAGGPRRPVIRLDREHAIEVLGLVPPLLYFLVIVMKRTLTATDAGVLTLLYVAYLVLLSRNPPQSTEDAADAPAVSRWALRQRGWRRPAAIGGLFAIGGGLLFLTAHPLVEAMLAIAAILGISQFFFIQWLAPVLSEFPEIVSTVNWARRVTPAPVALMNLVSSNINQWTVLAGMIPLVFGYSHWRHTGTWMAFHLDDAQRVEIAVTLLQTGLGVLLLASMEFGIRSAAALAALWAVELAIPQWRVGVAGVYALWMVALLVLYAVGKLPLRAPRDFWDCMRQKHDRPGPRTGNRPTG